MSKWSFLVLAAAFILPVISTQVRLPGVSFFVVPTAFPTSVFSSYYAKPAPTSEPQPAIFDPVLNITYPLNLTNPKNIPTVNKDPEYYPETTANLTAAQSEAVIQAALTEIKGIIRNNGTNCTKCVAALEVGQRVAKLAPTYVPAAMVQLCQSTYFATNISCVTSYAATNFGAIWTQVLALANVTGLDGQYICNTLNMTRLFPKPKPANATVPKPSGKRLKILHLSDFHLDPRYQVASEANCSSGLCCKYSGSTSTSQAWLPAPLYGAYKCDTPYYLGLAALQSIASLTGTGKTQSNAAWTIYTGDLVSHAPENEMSQAYVEYTETSIYSMFKSYLKGPVFPVLGNHDTSPENIDSPHSLPGPLGQQLSWNYNQVSALWQHNSWISASDAKEAATHYAAYSVKNHYGLRIITLNTDFWYKSNYLNLINSSDPDASGSLSFMISELQAAEDAGERVWIIGHVLSGWDGSNPLLGPTNLFYQIIDRYSPHVIAATFWGHTHEDQIMIYYSNNGTVRNSNTALNVGWIGPSITPLTNLNSGFRMYEVDSSTFSIHDAYTFYSDVSSYTTLNSSGPVYRFGYSTRETYGPAISWPKQDPLNARFWHEVTEAMEGNRTLVSIFNTYQGKVSGRSPNCTSVACATAKVCYMRSGNAVLGRECPQGFASVQNFWGVEDLSSCFIGLSPEMKKSRDG
ncbi:sphingomyelin phosphodiesteras-like protein [Amylocarpus encephaloides]|uniref:Sphingomyelin phosphodiesterase n=1 Tax=Amylocarpus encephaloides TaxID=45428 RepID=A0A9P7YHX5_9HELO|nr:sphingomyelin phosphodiesteras-like protein [Amylocarpus encephaloides]